MVSMWKRGSVMAILVAVLFVGGACDTGPTEPVTQPDRLEAQAPDEFLGGLLKRIIRQTVPQLVETVVTVIEEVATVLIGPAGGIVEVLDHDLNVPAGAISRPAVFSMTALGGTTVEVDLRARDARTGKDVGASGFERPVQLALSYADVEVRDPSKLTIVRIMPDGRRIPVKSRVDRETQQVIAELDHFSRYGLCRN